MKGVFSAPGDCVYFKSRSLFTRSLSSPRLCFSRLLRKCWIWSDFCTEKTEIGTKQWRYYNFGPKAVPPLICLPGTVGTADVYYKQIMSLSMKGNKVISIDIPHARNHHEWVQAFEKSFDAIDVHHIHLCGTSLGGFLAQLFAQHCPRQC